MLVTSKELVDHALKNGYAVGAFNVINQDSIYAVLEAAKRTKSPVIIQLTGTTFSKKYDGIPYVTPEVLTSMVLKIGKEYKEVPYAMHLDHGRSVNFCKKMISLGCSSAMMDGTLDVTGKLERSYEENICVTRDVVDFAHSRKHRVSVEGELGKLGQTGVEISTDYLTQPAFVIDFYRKTEVDMLAISIGTTHGLFIGKPIIAHKRIEEIHHICPDLPLVMHGGTGVPDEDVKIAISKGIAKINIDTEIRIGTFAGISEYIYDQNEILRKAATEGKPGKYDNRDMFGAGRTEATRVIMNKMILFGSAGRI